MKNIFPEGTIHVIYKKDKNWRELISPSLFPKAQVEPHPTVSECKSRRCDIYQIYFVCMNGFSDEVWPNIFLLTLLMVIKPKALKINCKKVIMTLKVSYGVEKSIGKPITLSHGME